MLPWRLVVSDLARLLNAWRHLDAEGRAELLRLIIRHLDLEMLHGCRRHGNP